ncbi:rCG35741 [Rattus norvegicus]|uniref:RCG35741 n=1 Tax=Rattus norvegicus TaxID=10116 RepID=A6IJQ5_RAT|nr:rCG35741 [Rattus norvegicus]
MILKHTGKAYLKKRQSLLRRDLRKRKLNQKKNPHQNTNTKVTVSIKWVTRLNLILLRRVKQRKVFGSKVSKPSFLQMIKLSVSVNTGMKGNCRCWVEMGSRCLNTL